MDERSAYANTSYDLTKWLPSLHRMVLQPDIEGTDGIFPSGCTTFISSAGVFSAYSLEANDTFVIPEAESNEGVYHINSVVDDNVLILNRTAVTSATSITWMATKDFNRIVQDASDTVDENLADLSPVIPVPFDKQLYQRDLSDLGDLDESLPLSLKGYKLDLEILSGPTFPVGITIAGWGEYLDWRNKDVETKFTTDATERPVTDAKSQSEAVTFTAAGTATTTKYWREIDELSAAVTGSGTLTVRYTVPRTVKRLTALEASIQILAGNYAQAVPNRSDWVEELMGWRTQIYDDYREGVRNLAEMTEATLQRGRTRTVKIIRG